MNIQKNHPELLSYTKKIKKTLKSDNNQLLFDLAIQIHQIAEKEHLSRTQKSQLAREAFVGYSDRYVRELCAIVDHGCPQLLNLAYTGKISKAKAAAIAQLDADAQLDALNDLHSLNVEEKIIKQGDYSVSIKHLKNGKKSYTIKHKNLQLRWTGANSDEFKNDLETLLKDLHSMDLSD